MRRVEAPSLRHRTIHPYIPLVNRSGLLSLICWLVNNVTTRPKLASQLVVDVHRVCHLVWGTSPHIIKYWDDL